MLLFTLGLVLQTQAVTPPARVVVVRDSGSRSQDTRLVRGKRPVTEAHLRTAFGSPEARELLDRARQARLGQDSALVSYDATVYQRMSAKVALSRLARERLAFRSEHAGRVRWHRDVGVWVDVTGARTVLPGIPAVGQREAESNLANESDHIVPIPYFPGQEQLWMGTSAVRATVDENELVHPLAAGSEAWYSFRTGDSLTFRLPDGTRVRLRELQVRPREPLWNVVVGSLWFDRVSGQLVRAAYRFSVPMEIDAFVREEDPTAFEDVPMLVKPLIFPMRGEISVITVEYALHAGRVWLPRLRTAEGRGQAGFGRVSLSMEQKFTYTSVNALDSLPHIPLAAAPVRDSAERAALRAAARARRDSIREGTLVLPPRIAQCDTASAEVRVRPWSSDTRVPMATRLPCDRASLATSPDLPASIYESSEDLFELGDREDLIAAALGMNAQPPLVLDPRRLPRPIIQTGIALLRYNRVEGLSAGVSARQILGGGYALEGTARIGSGDREPNVHLRALRTNLSDELFVSGYNSLLSARDWGNPLAFGASVSAALFGRDEGLYYRVSGAEVGGRRDRGSPIEWRAFVERHRPAAVETDLALFGRNALPNIAATPSVFAGGGVRIRHARGLDPEAFRTFTDLRAESATGDSTYARAAADLTLSDAIGPVAAALTLAGGTSVGALPPQRQWYLGGAHTVRGQRPDTSRHGTAFWLVRGEIGRTIQGVRPVLFGDLGWTGDRNRMAEVGRPLSGVGAGLSIMDGLLRLDLARGVFPERRWRLDLYLEY